MGQCTPGVEGIYTSFLAAKFLTFHYKAIILLLYFNLSLSFYTVQCRKITALDSNMTQLSKDASIEEIKKHLNTFKIQAINLISKQVTGANAHHLEPKELKILTDTALNLEDSYNNTIGEGEQARKISRILDKYGDSYTIPEPSQQTPILAEVVSND